MRHGSGVTSTSADPSKLRRQDVCLRALQRYRPEVEVYFGHVTRNIRSNALRGSQLPDPIPDATIRKAPRW